MTKIEANRLALGLYVLHWKNGGASLAAVGITYDGSRWFAPCNWTSADNARPMVASTDWGNVDHVEIVAGHDFLMKAI